MLFNLDQQITDRIESARQCVPRRPINARHPRGAHLTCRVCAIDDPDSANPAPAAPAPDADVVNTAVLHRGQYRISFGAGKFCAADNPNPV